MENLEFQELMLEHFRKVLSKLESMDKRLSSMESELGTVKSEMGTVKSELNQVKENQIRMENELGEKITALFDGYSLRGDQIDNLRMHFDNRLDLIADDFKFLLQKSFKQDQVINEIRKIR